jgi:predicted transcriptional regulator
MKSGSGTDEDLAFREAVAASIEAAETGRVADYEQVRLWILSWGTEREIEPPTCVSA